MKKVITLSALAAVAFTSEMGNQFVDFDDQELFNIKDLPGKQNPVKIYRDLGFEDQTDLNLFQHTDLIPKTKNLRPLIKEPLKVPADVKLDDDEYFVDFDDEELFNVKDLPGKQAPIKIYRDLGFEDQTDNNLFHFGDANGELVVPKKPHLKNNLREFLKEHAKVPHDVKLDDDEYFLDFDDEELFNVKDLPGKQAPIKIYRDLGFEDQTDNNLAQLGDILKEGNVFKKNNIKGLKETLKVPADVKLDDDEFFVDFDDEELFVDFDDDELFNMKEIHGKPEPVKVYRDLGFEDQTDNHFFQLENLD